MMDALAEAVGRFAQIDGDHATALQDLTLHRRSAPTQPLHCVYNLSLVFLPQGAKRILLGRSAFDFQAGQSMLTTLDVPVISHVTRATLRKPFLAMLLALDAYLIAQTAAEMELPRPPREQCYRPISIERVDADLADCLLRLILLLDEPDLAPHLAPLVRKEIVVRLLSGPHGPHLRHRVSAGSPGERIAKAVTWLKMNFARSFPMDQLAARAHMSLSTFRQHFRSITGTSPLQFQKQLRLQEARHLMLDRNLDAGQASRQVGYESESQFSREYRRLFGAPPKQDVRRLHLDLNSLAQPTGTTDTAASPRQRTLQG